MDNGANTDCKENIYSNLPSLGRFMPEKFRIDNPRTGLLSGEEKEKAIN